VPQVQLKLQVRADEVERLSDALMELECLSVSVEDLDLGSSDEKPLYGEPGMEIETAGWERSRLVALFENDAEADAALSLLVAEGLLNTAQLEAREAVEDLDWVRLTQAQFEPIRVTEKLVIVPSWHEAPPAQIAIELDPGQAFGTGSHPTTHLCLQWLCANEPQGLRVLDYGAGSGILAIAAMKLGAARALAVDIDPSSVTTSQYNAQNNQVQLECALPGALEEELAGCFDLVLANILSTPLKLLAPLLASRLRTGGSLVLSGILERQAEEMIAHYAPFAKLSLWKAHEGWVCLAGTKI
jgi:ribosomal protein L11 methyltransferase